MAQTKQVETALLTEHFGWTPISFIDEVINTINDLLNRLVDTIEEGLKSADPGPTLGFSAKAAAEGWILDTDDDGREIFPEEEVKKEIEEGVHKLETLLENTVDKNFDKWEIYVLRNCLSLGKEVGEIMGWIRLRGYEDLTLPPSTTATNDTTPAKDPAKPRPTPESLMLLRRKLQETQKLHSLLLAEKHRNAAILNQLRSLTSPDPQNPHPGPSLSFLTSPASTPIPPSSLPTSTAFPLTQLPHLRRLLAQLKPYVASLPRLDDAVSEADSKARERKSFVEAQTRRVLERQGVEVTEGLGMGRAGGSGNGGVNRRVGEDELRALEGVVASMPDAEGAREEKKEEGSD